MTQLYHAATPSFVRHSHEPPPALGRLAGKKATWRDLVVRRPRVLASVFAVSFFHVGGPIQMHSWPSVLFAMFATLRPVHSARSGLVSQRLLQEPWTSMVKYVTPL